MGVPNKERGSYDTAAYYTNPIASSSSQPKATPRKRKANDALSRVDGGDSSSSKLVIDLTEDTPPKKRKKKDPAEEKRLKRWRDKAPQSYQEIRARALTQRMFALDRQRDLSNPELPTETVTLAGTTGNVYSIRIDKVPSCNCPHALKGNQCKHIVYVLARVLRVPEHLEYQLAFITPELQEIFARAPPLPSEQAANSEKDGNRKSLEGECPICCVDFEPENTTEEVVYCKASCGNNVHKTCFEQWAATAKGKDVTCPFCRATWQGDEDMLKKLTTSGTVNDEGYVNVADQLGLGPRDYSTYHQPWVRKRYGYSY